MSDPIVLYICIRTPCPFCQGDDTRVIATRRFEAQLIRRHVCSTCNRHFRSRQQTTLGGRPDPATFRH